MIEAGPKGRVARAAASALRHDLVAPINQILGFAELLVGDADDQGLAFRAQSLRSIRALGKRALEAIDGALIRPGDGPPPDPAAVAPGVVGPTDAIVEACRALEEASALAPDRAAFIDDLGRIRDAASLLAILARRASAGADDAGPGDPGSPI